MDFRSCNFLDNYHCKISKDECMQERCIFMKILTKLEDNL